ncbi:hypothetical protein FRB96_003627 [Tulasnella sp. 330]|nr:hypothetical protein FRB96_003627 [Tulasnella sp. 330]
MSVHIPASDVATPYEDDDDHSQGSGQSEEDNKELENFDDWVDEDEHKTKSLFDDHILDSPTGCIKYDRENHGFDLLEVSTTLAIRQKPSSSALENLDSSSKIFSDDAYLKPSIEDDPLLREAAILYPENIEYDADALEDSEEKPKSGSSTSLLSQVDALRKIKKLEAQLSQAHDDLRSFRSTVKERFDLLQVAGIGFGSAPRRVPEPRDDDTHYFDSYSYNDIHAVMIQDTVRTSSYARFVMSNPAIFRDAVVMDVGCGTGILSLFAARAGARRVFAVDASNVVEKARQNVKENNFENIITVIRAKVEDLDGLPDGVPYVDVIISEWMGYCCIYESMLDSVLIARDKFLRKDGTVVAGEDESDEGETKGQGLMVPSQCRMEMGLGDVKDILRERITFWDDVYGFRMTAMANEVYDECVMDVVGPETLLGDAMTIKDLPLQHITIRSLDFRSPFRLTTTRSGELNAFIVYFDTFFTADGKDLPPNAQVSIYNADFAPGQVIRIGERRASESGDEKRKSVDAALKRRKSSMDILASTGGQTMDTIAEQKQFSASPKSVEAPLPPPAPPAPPAPTAASVSPAVSTSSLGPTSILSKRPTLSQGGTPRRASTGAGLPKPISFSTGPKSMPTHWKQGLFLLRSPIRVRKGTTVTGSFHCRKSESNSRELDVEIHYLVEDPPLGAGAPIPTSASPREAVVQMFKVR